MDNQQLVTVITALISVLAGALLGGGTAIVITGRIIKSVLESPVLVRSLEVAAASWPAPVREAVGDAGKLLTEITDDVPTVPVG